MQKRTSARVARWMVAAVTAGASVLVVPGVARAISGGEYSPAQQDCSPNADAYNRGGDPEHATAEPGCHTVKVNVESGDTRYAEAGVDQLPNGTGQGVLIDVGNPGEDNFPNAGCAAVNTDGTGGGKGNNCGTDDPNRPGLGGAIAGSIYDPANGTATVSQTPDPTATATNVAANGAELYFGADDNLDAGEHDAVDGTTGSGTEDLANGPSDGGAIHAHVRPQAATTAPTASDPVPVAGASFGSCADGICEDVTTYRHVVYRGGDTSKSRDVADYEANGGKKWDPYNCSSGNATDEQNCKDADHPDGMHDYWANEGTVYAEPGVQVYEDPDPQASPIDPVKEFEDGAGGSGFPGLSDNNDPTLYPLPGTYVGTCGVIVNGSRNSTPDTCEG